MQRFLLAFALSLGLVASASAQNSNSSIAQTGDENDAIVTQNDASTAIISQDEIGLTPADPGNIVRLIQDDSEARVTQSGNSNAAQLDQEDGASARITQTGAYNWVVDDIDGIGTIRPGPGNFFDQRDGSSLVADQNGISNTVDGSQRGRDQVANVFQDGHFNTATLDQRSRTRSTARIDQIGSSVPPVDPSGVAIADRQRAEVKQDGRGGHLATISQTSGPSTLSPPDQGSNLAVIDQDGRDQTARISQVGSDHMATVRQSDRDNRATVTQTEADQEALVRQTGRDNLVTITQGNTVPLTQVDDPNNLVDVLQSGDDNIGRITQDGISLEADLRQSGDDNRSRITQTGDNHEAMVTQSSDGNVSTVTQIGSGHSATVIQ
ncbi:hypothetical protein [Rubrivirga sp. IMCC43871]|uniref:hypothetical protein n=1 Tax=Rubrivirga sp. IMCC43871 TaxID=3391575 RepID=UPI00398FBD48